MGEKQGRRACSQKRQPNPMTEKRRMSRPLWPETGGILVLLCEI
jgi:hypothetical protein